METPIEVLRVEQSGISKELGRFRACDAETRSLFCREWAQYIYKKHFVWSAKTVEELVPEGKGVNENNNNTLKAGKYQINFITAFDEHGDPTDQAFKKEQSALLGKKFEALAAEWTSSTGNDAVKDDSLLAQIISGCQLWMTLPSGFMGLPDSFEPVEFNPYPDAIPLIEDPKDPSQLLDPLIIERQALCLPSDCFHLLKNLTGDILLSHTNPTCGHSKPASKTPADLEVERAIFNEHEANAVNQALKELCLALDRTWHPLNQFLSKLNDLEKRRVKLMGRGCQESIDEFFANQKFVSFVDSWVKDNAQYKNKKSTPEEIQKLDDLFEGHLNGLKSKVKEFMDVFVPKILQEIHTLTTDLWKIVVPTIYEIGERLATRDSIKGSEASTKLLNEFKTLDKKYLQNLESTKEVEMAKQRIVENMNNKVNEYMVEIDGLLKLYKENARSNLSGRVDKLNNKDFKKKIKKLESGYYSVRQTFRYEVTEKIFPESLFCKFALICLVPLLQEGEMAEAITIETEVKRFMEAYKDLWLQRSALLHRFEEGVHTGRRELAGVLGKLFLKEGMRIQGDNLALKRQNNLLKSMGMDVPEKKTKKKSSSGTSSPAQQVEPALPSPFKKSATAKKSPVPESSVSTSAINKPSPSKSAAVKTSKDDVKSLAKESPKVVSPESVKTVSAPAAKKLEVKKPEVAKPVEVKKVEEKKPLVEVKKPAETKKVEEVKKPAEVKKVEEVKKPVETKKPVEVKKVAPPPEPKKPAFEPKKYTEPKPKVKSSKIPAPAPVLEPRVEPKPVKSESKQVEKKKKAAAPLKKPSDEIQEWNTICASVMASAAKSPSADDSIVDADAEIQEWNDVVKEVAATPVTGEVQDWTSLMAQVQSEEEKKRASVVDTPVANKTTLDNLESGWSAIASKKPAAVAESNWSNAATMASSETSSIKDSVDWETPKIRAASPAPSNVSGAWSTTATAGWNNSPTVTEKSVTPSGSSIGGWNAMAEKAALSTPPGWGNTARKPEVSAPPGWENVAAKKPEVSAPPGWGSVAEKKPEVSAPPGWGSVAEKKPEVSAPPGWGSVAEKEPEVSAPPGWGSVAEKPKVSAPPGWGSAAEKESAVSALPDWGNVTEKKPEVSAPPGWNNVGDNRSATSSSAELPSTTVKADAALSLGGWGRPSVPSTWFDKKNNAAAVPPALAPSPATKKAEWNSPSSNVNATPKKTDWNSSTTAGAGWDGAKLPWEENGASNPVAPAAAAPTQMPVATAPFAVASRPSYEEPKAMQVISPTASKPPGLAVAIEAPKVITATPTIPPPFGLASSHLSSSQLQFQEPLPSNLNEMPQDMLLQIVNNLHRENGSLIQCVHGLQQEMQMMTTRYAEIMSLARERESQNLSLYESRKQTEMEEIRRYVLSMEARIKQMEEKKVTAGFGNQDLFAGYREEMKTSPQQQQNHHGGRNNYNNRKLWQKNNSVVRCGNCGEIGHASSDCKTNCRYCGSSDHLSESCPMN